LDKDKIKNLLPYTQYSKEILNDFETQDLGLSNEEAKNRLNSFGKNELASGKKHGKLYRFFSQFKDVMLIILIVAAGVNAVVAIIQNAYGDLIDVGIILGIVLLNAIIGYIQESKAEDALASLKKLTQPYVRVRRNGVLERVLNSEVVVGDILILEAGDICCADVYLLESASLTCDESSLTGESLQIQKISNTKLKKDTPLGERINMIFSGSIISYGRGVGVVVATGMNTELGKIAGMLNASEDEITPIQQKLAKLGKLISYVVIGIAVLIFVVNVLVKSSHDVVTALMVAIAIAVAAIPESLPAVITIIMSLGVSRMSKQRAIIRKMHAVETLGSCQIICSDKTGTLTQNKMTVKSIYVNGTVIEADKFNKQKYGTLIHCMSLCNDSAKGEKGYVGDPTEIALVEFAEELEIQKHLLEKDMPRVAELPFDSKRKMMTTFHKYFGKIVGFTKGAPDVLLANCEKVLLDGEEKPLTKELRNDITNAINLLSSKGLRTLGHAYKEHKENSFALSDEKDLIFLGIVAMRDPPREQAKEAVATCIEAGMKPIMITGDHAITAREIAKEVGIYKDGDIILTGAELDRMPQNEYLKIIPNVTVYARVSPENKVRIVESWKSLDKIVAMTGDGVNDAPSIKRADIGVGMGITGTEVTKEVADMVLTDDNFATIIKAVKEGRTTYQNIKKVILFLFGTNLVEVMSLLIITLFMPQLTFLTALQILFVNLVTDTLPAISLSVEKAEKDIMKLPPRDKKEGLFAGVMPIMIGQFIWQTILIVALFVIVYNLTGNNVLATTMSFVTLSLCQIFHIINVRTSHSIFYESPFTNWVFWLTFAGGILINVLVVSIPAVAGVFGLVPLTIIQWLIIFAISFSIIPIVEIVKWIVRIINLKKSNKK